MAYVEPVCIKPSMNEPSKHAFTQAKATTQTKSDVFSGNAGHHEIIMGGCIDDAFES